MFLSLGICFRWLLYEVPGTSLKQLMADANQGRSRCARLTEHQLGIVFALHKIKTGELLHNALVLVSTRGASTAFAWRRHK